MKEILLSYVVILLFLISSCSPIKSDIIEEYDSKLEYTRLLLEERDSLVNNIEKNFLEPEIHKHNIDDYLEWLESNRDDLTEFKLFIEANYEELEKAGKNPVLIRDLLKIMLEESENEESFYGRCNAIFNRYND